MITYASIAPDRLHRVSFGPNGIALRSWHAADVEDRLGKRTFGHRWDDPRREFRSLYTASSSQGAFIETLQDLRPNLSFFAGLAAIELEPGEELPAYCELDASYFDNLYACEIAIQSQPIPFIDIVNVEVIGIMRSTFAGLATDLGLRAIDAATMLGPNRELTQAFARAVWEPGYAGIVSPCVLGHPYQNWTVFESGHETNAFRAELTVIKADAVTLDHPDFIDALNALHMSIDHGTTLLRATPQELAPATRRGKNKTPVQ